MGNYRGEGLERRDCDGLAAHYAPLQAICDALGHAAQLDQSDAIGRGDHDAAERAYGAWLAFRGVLRVVEGIGPNGELGNLHTDLTPTETAMLALVDWKDETFRFPGREKFDGVEHHLPGEGPA